MCMKICNNCNREYDDGLNFCSKCGGALTAKPQEYFCPSCGKSLGESFDRFCPYCGCQFGQVQKTIAVTTSADQNNTLNAESDSYTNNSYATTMQQSANRPGYFSKEYLFSLKGRRGRAEGLITWFIISAIFLGCIALGLANEKNPFFYLMLVIALLAWWANVANAVKRAHDFDRSGLWLLGCFIGVAIFGAILKAVSPELQTIVTFIAPYLLYIPKGTDGPNKYDV